MRSISFAELCEAVNQQDDDNSPIQADNIHDSQNNAVNVYMKQDNEFWYRLAELANANPDGLAELLGVDASSVVNWKQRLLQTKSIADKIKSEKQQQSMLQTGV